MRPPILYPLFAPVTSLQGIGPRLGKLVNEVVTSKDAAPWTYGLTALMMNLAERGLLNAAKENADA